MIKKKTLFSMVSGPASVRMRSCVYVCRTHSNGKNIYLYLLVQLWVAAVQNFGFCIRSCSGAKRIGQIVVKFGIF